MPFPLLRCRGACNYINKIKQRLNKSRYKPNHFCDISRIRNKYTLRESKWCNDSNITKWSYSTLISSNIMQIAGFFPCCVTLKCWNYNKRHLPQSRNRVYETVETCWVAMQPESFRVELNLPSQSNLICRMLLYSTDYVTLCLLLS